MSHSITAPLDLSSKVVFSCQGVERQPGQIMKRRDLAEDSTRQDNLDSLKWHTEAFPHPWTLRLPDDDDYGSSIN